MIKALVDVHKDKQDDFKPRTSRRKKGRNNDC